MQKMMIKAKLFWDNLKANAKRVLTNQKGDQITGWLIVILLVVVTGAFFLNTYQGAIVEIWEGIVDRIEDTFGL